VNYIGNRTQAANLGLAVINPQNHAIITVDSDSNLGYNVKRNSIRLISEKSFKVGSLVVMNAWHVPFGCAVWPSFWMKGGSKQWPTGGEIDVFEGVHNQAANQATLHTSAGCTLKTPMAGTGTVLQTNCDANSGCGVKDTSSSSYGQSAATAQGGIWAVLYDSQGIWYWHWPRNQIPADLVSSNVTPNPANFGTPIAYWDAANCNINTFFEPQKLLFDITLCGDWAGNTFTRYVP
ncbi:glycoside hydrolase family 16 protein, partial [Atractiella rhizophila]